MGWNAVTLLQKRGIEKVNKFDRIGDWQKFSRMMETYIKTPQTKYGTNLKFNDLLHYTGLRVMLWNILKYALRLWSGAGKKHDFEKIAHYAQMCWVLKERQGRKAPFFKDDVEGDYVVMEDIKLDRRASISSGYNKPYLNNRDFMLEEQAEEE